MCGQGACCRATHLCLQLVGANECPWQLLPGQCSLTEYLPGYPPVRPDTWVPAQQSILGCAVGPQRRHGFLCSVSILSSSLCSLPLHLPLRLVPVWALSVVHLQVLPLCLSALGLLSPHHSRHTGCCSSGDGVCDHILRSRIWPCLRARGLGW